MGFSVSQFVRQNILQLKPYSSARDEYAGTNGIFLDANENAYGSPGDFTFNRYPDPYQVKLKKAVSKLKGIPEDYIFLGNGSDEAVDLICRIFCEPSKDKILIMPPTYGMYEVCAGINNIALVHSPLSAEFMIDVQTTKKQIDSNPEIKLMFICSPNNPTGNCANQQDILELIKYFNGIVVLDEAYTDYAPEFSLLSQLKELPNVVILQTFSKAWGLAGLRLGMAFTNPEIVKLLNKVKPPYNISSYTQEVALKALEDQQTKDQIVKKTLADRNRLSHDLSLLSFVKQVYPSNSNFLLVKTTCSLELYRHLVKNNIIVRDRSSVPGCEGCLRITIGTTEENNLLIKACKDFEGSL